MNFITLYYTSNLDSVLMALWGILYPFFVLIHGCFSLYFYTLAEEPKATIVATEDSLSRTFKIILRPDIYYDAYKYVLLLLVFLIGALIILTLPVAIVISLIMLLISPFAYLIYRTRQKNIQVKTAFNLISSDPNK